MIVLKEVLKIQFNIIYIIRHSNAFIYSLPEVYFVSNQYKGPK